MNLKYDTAGHSTHIQKSQKGVPNITHETDPSPVCLQIDLRKVKVGMVVAITLCCRKACGVVTDVVSAQPDPLWPYCSSSDLLTSHLLTSHLSASAFLCQTAFSGGLRLLYMCTSG